MSQALPCICCGKQLENVDAQVTNQPFDGTQFETGGHYGSTVFDPMDGTELIVNVCDGCLTAAAGKGRVLRRVAQHDVRYDYIPWNS